MWCYGEEVLTTNLRACLPSSKYPNDSCLRSVTLALSVMLAVVLSTKHYRVTSRVAPDLIATPSLRSVFATVSMGRTISGRCANLAT